MSATELFNMRGAFALGRQMPCQWRGPLVACDGRASAEDRGYADLHSELVSVRNKRMCHLPNYSEYVAFHFTKTKFIAGCVQWGHCELQLRRSPPYAGECECTCIL